jgi:hypothetical protein
MPENGSRLTSFATLGLLGLCISLSATFRYMTSQPDLREKIPEFIAFVFLAGALYLFAVFLVERIPLRSLALLVIVGGALLMRLLILPSAPSISDDVFRYLWEGRVQRLGLNPYTVFPDLPGLEALQDRAHPLVTGGTVSTLYPPLTELSFRLVTTVWAYKVLYTVLDLSSIALLLAILAALKQPLHRVLIYAWNPTVIVSFAMSGHHDSLAIFLLLAANLALIYRKDRLSISFLALSVLSKFFPAILLPAFLKRTQIRHAGVFLGVVALGYVPFLGAGRALFKGLSDYAAGWEGNDSLFRLLRLAGNTKAQAELVALVLVLALTAYALKKQLAPLASCLLLISGLLFLSPNAFPWYFTWIVPFLCFNPSPSLLLMSITCVLGYSPLIAYSTGLPWKESHLMRVLEYVPVFALLVYEVWHMYPPRRDR